MTREEESHKLIFILETARDRGLGHFIIFILFISLNCIVIFGEESFLFP